MSGYEDAPEVMYGDGGLTADQALARARRALQVAEANADHIVAAYQHGDAVWTTADAIAHAAARAQIGRGWVELGAALRRAER